MSRYVLLALVWVVGCAAETGGTIELQRIAAPNSTCEVLPTDNTYSAIGFYDPQGNADPTAASTFFVQPLVVNNMPPPEEDAAVIFGNDREVRNQTNDVTLRGFDICWFRTDVGAQAERFGADAIDCDDVPATQRKFAPASGTIGQNEGKTVTRFGALSIPDLRAVLGDGYDPNPADPVASRNEVQITIRMQAIGNTPDGFEVRSNWFSYPVDVCTGCSKAACKAGTDTTLPARCLRPSSCVPFQSRGFTCSPIPGCT